MKKNSLAIGMLAGAIYLTMIGCGPEPQTESTDDLTQDVISGTFQLQDVATSECMDVAGFSKTKGAVLQEGNCGSASSQKWTFTSVGTGIYQLVNANSGLCAAVKSALTGAGAPILQWPCDTTKTNQRFSLSKTATHTYRLKARNSLKCVDTAGAAIIQGACTGSGFLLTNVPNGSGVDAGGGGSAGTGGIAGTDASAGSGGSAGSCSGASCGGLNPKVAPGGNFDLSLWELNEPVGAPDTIPPSKLVGAHGYQDKYFYTDPTDGAMTFWDPENGVTTPNSNFPRSELREMSKSGGLANWRAQGNHTLSAALKVMQVPSHVAVGQIHLGTGTPSSTKPLLELFYEANGAIKLGIEQSPAGGNEVLHGVGSVPLGTKWTYVIGLSGNTISVIIDGGAKQTFSMSSSFNNEGMYFKAGDYDQSVGSSTAGAKVQFYSLTIFHGP